MAGGGEGGGGGGLFHTVACATVSCGAGDAESVLMMSCTCKSAFTCGLKGGGGEEAEGGNLIVPLVLLLFVTAGSVLFRSLRTMEARDVSMGTISSSI